MTDIQKILKNIADMMYEKPCPITRERLYTIVDLLEACPSYMQTEAVLAGLKIKKEEENAQ